MAGRQAAQSITRYAGLQVQTSSLGLQIPVGGGTFRCKCNLVDYLDFKSTAQKSSTGKGGASQPTGYTYSATLILVICEGQIDAVTQVWANSKSYAFGSVGSNVANTGSTSACTQAGLSLATGAIGQAVWSYLTTAHPDHAIGYSGLAYAYAQNYSLDSSASPPNHSFEVVRTTGLAVGGGYAGPDLDPSLWITDFFTNAKTGVPSWPAGALDTVSLTSAANSYQKYCLASGLLISPVLDQARSASDALTEWLLATNSTVVWSEGLLKFVPYGDAALTANGVTYTPNLTPLYVLGDDDFIVQNAGDPPLLADIEDQSDAYNVVQLEYLDRTNQYNMAIALASDAANVAQFKQRKQDPTTVHCICTPSVAAIAAHLYLQRTLYIRAQYRFQLSWAFALLEPGDIVELTDSGLGLSAYPVRITQIDEDEKTGVLDLTCEDLLTGVANTPLYTMQNSAGAQPNTGIDPGGVEPNLMISSGDFTTGSWTRTGTTVTAAAAANPITGAVDAQNIVPTNVSGNHQLQQASVAIFAGANYTRLAIAKLNGGAGNYKFFNLRTASGSDTVNTLFDTSAGTLVSHTASGAAVAIGTPVITPLGSGWYLMSSTFQMPGPATTANMTVRHGPTVAAATATNFTGDGTSGIYLWATALYQGVDIRPYAKTTTVAAGPLIFNPPMALTPGGLQTWAAIAGGTYYGGCNVWVSYDGTNYTLVGTTQQGSARFGQLTASLASQADPDTTNTLSVDLSASNGSLTNASKATTDAGGTLCLVGSELIGFETATLTNPNRYDLVAPAGGHYLRRGMLNTPIAAHSAGDNFIRLDASIFAFPYNAQQVGRTATVKFQPFNIWGQGTTPLANCVAYSVVPTPATGATPTSTAWKATFTTISSGGVSQPVIIITGASDNLSASGIEFFYRQTGTAAWVSTGICGPTTAQKIITGVQSSQTYDVAVAYLVNGVLTPLQTITGSGSTTGTGGSGGAAGTALLNDSVAGAGKTFTIPASFTGAHVDIVLTGYAGAGNGTGSGKGGFTDRGGGGGNVVVVKGFPAVAGHVYTYTLPSGAGVDATVTRTGLSLVAHPGTDAASGSSGTGGANTGTQTATGSTSVTSYPGRNGGLVDTWDGGGPGATVDIPSGTVTNPGPDLTTDFTAGQIPGQGAAGMSGNPLAGGGANILIIARA